MKFAEKRKTVLSSGSNCLSFAPVAVIFKIHGQILYALVYMYVCMFENLFFKTNQKYKVTDKPYTVNVKKKKLSC